MPDVLIRDFPSEDLKLLDQQARRLGLSRSAFLRRQLHREARRLDRPVRAEDLSSFTDLLPDLSDPDVMRDAWA